MRYFINNVDSYLGKAFFKALQGTEENPTDNEIYATNSNPDNKERPKGVKKIINRSKPNLYARYLIESCDSIIYDMQFGDPTEIKRALNAFKTKYERVESEKVLVLISNLKTWKGSGRKEKKAPKVEVNPDDPNA
jgi:hypothetical protein